MDNRKTQQPTMLSFLTDVPNICSFSGLLCSVLGIYFAIVKLFPLAIIGIIWAILFDWVDGMIAKKLSGRTDHQKAFGGQLDSLIDVVSFGIFPAIFLLSYGDFSPWFIPGAFLIIAASVLRLSYFNIWGLIDDKTYMGLALDNNMIILSFVYLFEVFFSQAVFSIILYVLLSVLLLFNISSIPTPKFSKKWVYLLLLYTVVLSMIYGWIQWGNN